MRRSLLLVLSTSAIVGILLLAGCPRPGQLVGPLTGPVPVNQRIKRVLVNLSPDTTGNCVVTGGFDKNTTTRVSKAGAIAWAIMNDCAAAVTVRIPIVEFNPVTTGDPPAPMDPTFSEDEVDVPPNAVIHKRRTLTLAVKDNTGATGRDVSYKYNFYVGGTKIDPVIIVEQ